MALRLRNIKYYCEVVSPDILFIIIIDINLQINFDNAITSNHSKRDNVSIMNLLSYAIEAFTF